MKVTMYTINNCPFCDQEKAYLQSKGIAFEEKNLDQNREFLTEMLALGNNFKGVPVTKIEKDDGQSVVLKGFTQEEFDQAFTGNAAAAVPPVVAASDQPNTTPPSQPDPVTPPPVVEPPATPTEPQVPTPEAPSDTAVKADDAQTPTPPVNEPATPEPTVPPVAEPEAPPVVEPPTPPAPAPSDQPPSVQSTPANDPLAAILADLQNKSSDVPPAPVVPPVRSNIPPAQTPDAPTPPPIPDFPK